MTALAAAKSADMMLDESLVERFKSGDESAFPEVIKRYRDRIYGRVYRMLKNHDDAEEVTQDTFIRAHRNLDKFRGEASLSTWLHQIATNLAHNRYWYWWRRRRDRSFSLDQPLGDDSDATVHDVIADTTDGPGQETLTRELVNKVTECIDLLPAAHRDILVMRVQKNMSYEEISVILKINIGTVKSRIARARDSLRELMGTEFQ